jgi:membrane-associated phospholipid phosphatase
VRKGLAALALLATTNAEAAPRDLHWDFEVDGPITLSGALGWVTTISLRETIGPSACRWCATNSFDVAARNAFKWTDTSAAIYAVNVIGFVVGPTFVLGADLLAASHDGAWKQFFTDALLVAEAAVLASDVNLMVRFLAARERPWATALSAEQKAQPNQTRDQNLSFDSGHATFMFAVATSAGTIATMRGYRWAPLVWIVGMPLALATSYLRVASDDHWMTDVLIGIGMGAAFGFSIPFFAHKPIKVVPAGSTLAVRGVF